MPDSISIEELINLHQSGPQIQPVSNAYTATFTSLTEVGSVTKAGSFFMIGQLVFVSIKVTTSGGGTSEATAGTTYVTVPYNPANAGVAIAANVGTLLGIGTGVVTTNGRLYVPTWAATSDEIAISACYLRAN